MSPLPETPNIPPFSSIDINSLDGYPRNTHGRLPLEPLDLLLIEQLFETGVARSPIMIIGV
jgi:hypothetical protein